MVGNIKNLGLAHVSEYQNIIMLLFIEEKIVFFLFFFI